MSSVRSFLNDRQSTWSVADDVLVRCPRCKACAIVSRRDRRKRDLFAPRRLVCKACGLTKGWAGNHLMGGSNYGPPTDPAFGLPLWLQLPCCGHTLWAYNATHLEFVREYVEADLRPRWVDGHGWRNGSLASRLPRWIVSRRNREPVLKAIRRLQERLGRG